MEKVIIGILPTVYYDINNNPFSNYYAFFNNYTKMFDDEVLLVGILLKNGTLDDDILNLCDGFLLPGGKDPNTYHYLIIDHALKYNKPVLGICLGMQAISTYFYLLEKFKNIGSIISWSNNNINQEELLLEYINSIDHGSNLIDNKNPTIEEITNSNHDITITDKLSIIYDIYKKSKLNVITMHKYKIKHISKYIKVTSVSDDNVIESIEYINNNYFILGVQYHPEFGDKEIFKYFVNQTKKRKDRC